MIGTDENLQLIKDLLRIDDDGTTATDNVIKLLMGAAERWLATAGVVVSYDNEQIVDLVAMYVGQRYADPDGLNHTAAAEQALASAVEQVRIQQLTAAEATE